MNTSTISPETPLNLAFFLDTFVEDQPDRIKYRRFQSGHELFTFRADDFFPMEQFEEKKDVPLYGRGWLVGGRKKRNFRPPLLLVLDVDKVATPLVDYSASLETLDVDHYGYTTWSHEGGELHSYRIITDLLFDTWGKGGPQRLGPW